MSPVIINEFELVTAPESPAGEGEPDEGQSTANPPAQSPVLEIERVVRHQYERLERIWAH
jgi:hypothetical protein